MKNQTKSNGRILKTTLHFYSTQNYRFQHCQSRGNLECSERSWSCGDRRFEVVNTKVVICLAEDVILVPPGLKRISSFVLNVKPKKLLSFKFFFKGLINFYGFYPQWKWFSRWWRSGRVWRRSKASWRSLRCCWTAVWKETNLTFEKETPVVKTCMYLPLIS